MFSPQKIAVVFQYDTPHLEVRGVPCLDGVWAEKIVTFLSLSAIGQILTLEPLLKEICFELSKLTD